METSKWLLVFWAVLVFLFEKKKILATYLSRIHPLDLQNQPHKSSSSCRNLPFHFDASGTPTTTACKKCYRQTAFDRKGTSNVAFTNAELGIAPALPLPSKAAVSLQLWHCTKTVECSLLFKVSSFSVGFPGSPAWCGLLVPALCFF